MEITLTGIAILVTTLIGWGFKIWREIKKDELNKEQQDQLIRVANMAVLASEELGASEKWDRREKLTFTANAIREGAAAISPVLAKTLTDETIKILIHSALVILDLGTSGKEKAKAENSD